MSMKRCSMGTPYNIKWGDTMFNKRNGEMGATNLEMTIMMVCLLIVACVFVFGMIGAAKTTSNQMSGNGNIIDADTCVNICKIRFVNGLTDVCKFNACTAKCQ